MRNVAASSYSLVIFADAESRAISDAESRAISDAESRAISDAESRARGLRA
jgi:hypothetical protein